jgi:mono/diheme cytochrome c family protein
MAVCFGLGGYWIASVSVHNCGGHPAVQSGISGIGPPKTIVQFFSWDSEQYWPLEREPEEHGGSPIWWIGMRWNSFLLVVAAASIAAQSPLGAQSLEGDPASGRQIVTTQCSSCHRVQPMLVPGKGDSSLGDKDAPSSFQSIADLPSTTRLALNVFLHSNHKNMPDLILSRPEAKVVIAYILSLKK